MYFGKSGNSPEPFDAVDGSRLAGPDGSHPLHDVSIGELLRPIVGCRGRRVRLRQPRAAGDRGRRDHGPGPVPGAEGHRRPLGQPATRRAAAARVPQELARRATRSTGAPRAGSRRTATCSSRTRSWSPSSRRVLAAGQEVELSFRVPAPRLGPPTAHLGEAIIAWALEVRWDVARGRRPVRRGAAPGRPEPGAAARRRRRAGRPVARGERRLRRRRGHRRRQRSCPRRRARSCGSARTGRRRRRVGRPASSCGATRPRRTASRAWCRWCRRRSTR